MKITLVSIGKTQDRDIANTIADYAKRINHYSTFNTVETTDEKVISVLERFDHVFLLDEKGREYDSPNFAKFIQKQLNAGLKSIAFVIGGPYGFSKEIYDMANDSITLSKMTFPHQLVRMIFLEQLYRAFTILKNEKYHHAG